MAKIKERYYGMPISCVAFDDTIDSMNSTGPFLIIDNSNHFYECIISLF